MKIFYTLGFSLLSLLLFATGISMTLGFFNPELASYLLIFNLPSLAVILGGTFFQLFVSFPTPQIGQAIRDFLPGIYSRRFDQNRREDQIKKILFWQSTYQKSRQNAWSLLNNKEVPEFEAYLFKLLETNYKLDDFIELYQAKLSSIERKTSQSFKVFQALAGSSPAFGMMGTVIGLMVMFNNFENDVQLARGIGLALMTTLYGIFFAQIIWIPAAKRIIQFNTDLKFNYDVILEGIVLILDEKSPMFIRDFLKAKIENR
jgi:chemotaxis protein MotA